MSTSTKSTNTKGSFDLFSAASKVMGSSDLKDLPELSSAHYFHGYTYGLPIRNYLPLCRLLGTDVLALSRALTIVGPEESMKSSIGWFLMRLILQAGGFVVYIDTEKKGSERLILSIVDIPDAFNPNTCRVLPVPCDTREQALEMLYLMSSGYDKLAGGRKIPMGILFDSIKAAPSTKTVETKDEGKDSPGYGSMHDAKAFQDYLMCTMSKNVSENPILLVATNHQMKKKAEFPGQTVFGTYEAGGAFKEFAWSWKLQMRQTKQEERAERNIPVLGLQMGKTGLHEKQGTNLPLRFLMEYDKYGKGHGRFDWDTSLALMLSNADIFPKARTKDIISIHGSGLKYSCGKLGLKEVEPGVIGRAIHDSPEWRDRILREVFKIAPAGIFHNGKVYQPPSDDDESLPDGSLRGLDIMYGEPPEDVPRTTGDNRFPSDLALDEDMKADHLSGKQE